MQVIVLIIFFKKSQTNTGQVSRFADRNGIFMLGNKRAKCLFLLGFQ
jgi:hypothetical protein